MYERKKYNISSHLYDFNRTEKKREKKTRKKQV